MEPKLSVKIGKLSLRNPVMVASGTFGYAEEFGDFMDVRKLAALVSKTITLRPRTGNPMPRTCETPAGMLNSIGLENPGLEMFLAKKLPALSAYGVPVIVSIASEDDPAEFLELARRLEKVKEVAALELNISCPNIRVKRLPHRQAGLPHRQAGRQSAKLISQDPEDTYRLVKSVRRLTRKTLITKLSPNVTDITEIALAAESGGSDALSLINTLSGMSIDVATRKPKIACVSAGLSGPAIRPVAIRMVWQVYQKIKIPIIGMGGIIDTFSALEFFLAGASAVAIGTANFINPAASVEILEGIKKYLREQGIIDIHSLTGSMVL